MTNEHNAVSNWTLATGTKPGERYVYRDVPSTPGTHRPSDAQSRPHLSVTETRS
jgi:hypothetical protein